MAPVGQSGVIASVAVVVFLSALCNAASPRPHIIVIVADDLGYNDVSFHGSDQIPTPNIDKLAYSGVLLNNYYVSPICTPTRSAIMTGRHPIHTGMQHSVIFGDSPYGLPLTETIMPQYFNDLGYTSRMVGKWHLGFFAKEYTPVYRGFESHFGYYQGCEDYYDHTYEADRSQWGYDFRRDMTVMYNYTGQYSTTLFTDEAVSIINTHDQSQPLFLYLPYQAVHSGNQDSWPSPLQAPQKYVDRFPNIKNKKRQMYAAMVAALDDGVGDVYAALVKNNMINNSVIVFTTDNGGPANGFDYNAANNFPLRGLKATLWEGGVRGVGFLHSPLLQKQGYVSQKMLHVCDWVPTLYEAAGGDPKILKNLDGVSAWEMLSTDGPAVRNEMLHNIDPIGKFAGLRVGDYKLVTGDIAYGGYNDWYPPWQLPADDRDLHVDVFKSDRYDMSRRSVGNEGIDDRSQKFVANQGVGNERGEGHNSDLFSDIQRNKGENSGRFSDNEKIDGQNSDTLRFVSSSHSSPSKTEEEITKFSDSRSENTRKHTPTSTSQNSHRKNSPSFGSGSSIGPVTINCGPKPQNASTNCEPKKSPCLFHIPSDPCEFNNIAAAHPDIVSALYARLVEYMYTMIPPGNKPIDDRGNPKYHNGTWVPWIIL